MDELRLDRVIRKRLLGGEAFSLILNGSGLYLIHTGTARTVQQIAAGNFNGMPALQAAEARLSTVPPRDLAKEVGNLYLPLPEIHRATVREDDDHRPIEIRLYTSAGDFTLAFPLTPAAQVRALGQALIHAHDPPEEDWQP